VPPNNEDSCTKAPDPNGVPIAVAKAADGPVVKTLENESLTSVNALAEAEAFPMEPACVNETPAIFCAYPNAAPNPELKALAEESALVMAGTVANDNIPISASIIKSFRPDLTLNNAMFLTVRTPFIIFGKVGDHPQIDLSGKYY
jgi:hypothetical protein